MSKFISKLISVSVSKLTSKSKSKSKSLNLKSKFISTTSGSYSEAYTQGGEGTTHKIRHKIVRDEKQLIKEENYGQYKYKSSERVFC